MDDFEPETYDGPVITVPVQLYDRLKKLAVDMAGIYQIDSPPFGLYDMQGLAAHEICTEEQWPYLDGANEEDYY